MRCMTAKTKETMQRDRAFAQGSGQNDPDKIFKVVRKRLLGGKKL
jgi:hypothetical protein